VLSGPTLVQLYNDIFLSLKREKVATNFITVIVRLRMDSEWSFILSVDQPHKREEHHIFIKYLKTLNLGLITLLVLAFWPAHENGLASYKSNKTVPKLSYFCTFSLTSYFQLQKRGEMTVLDLPLWSTIK